MPYISKSKLKAYEDLKKAALEIYQQARFTDFSYRKCSHGMIAHRIWYCDACFFAAADALERLGIARIPNLEGVS